MKLSIENLKQGIKWWQQKGNWTDDFHNSDYYELYKNKDGGLTEQWLLKTVDRLAQWRAIRSRIPPNTKPLITKSLKAKLPNIRAEYQRILSISKEEPSIVSAKRTAS